MSEKEPPSPPWRARLKGLKDDLEDLATCLQGNIRVFQQDGAHFLESELLNSASNPNEAHQRAKELLRVISSVERVRRSIAKPVEVTGIYWNNPNGTWGRMLVASSTFTVFDGIVRLSAPTVFERSVELALRDEGVRINLDDFCGEWDFPRLRRIAELIFLDVGAGDVKRGVQEVVSRGWAFAQDCARFRDTVNYGDGKALGAHSHARRSHGQNPMNVSEAGDFLRGVLARWVESRI
jgi:hypothetical protein